VAAIVLEAGINANLVHSSKAVPVLKAAGGAGRRFATATLPCSGKQAQRLSINQPAITEVTFTDEAMELATRGINSGVNG
jgi:hypothetical protein